MKKPKIILLNSLMKNGYAVVKHLYYDGEKSEDCWLMAVFGMRKDAEEWRLLFEDKKFLSVVSMKKYNQNAAEEK